MLRSLELFANPVLVPPPITPSWCCIGFFGLFAVLVVLYFLARKGAKLEREEQNKKKELEAKNDETSDGEKPNEK